MGLATLGTPVSPQSTKRGSGKVKLQLFLRSCLTNMFKSLMLPAVLAILAFVSSCSAALTTPPTCGGTWCATVKEIMYTNETISSSHSFDMCMDTVSLNWKQTKPDGSYSMLNTADNKLYNVNARGKCTVSVPQGVADASQMPFSFMDIDSAAHFQGQANSPDSAIDSSKYYHNRPSYSSNGVKLPAEQMTWYVLPSSDDATFQMVETTCGQTYGTTPGDGGTSSTQSGNRDFSSNFDAAAGADSATYTVPESLDCESSNEEVTFASLF